MKETYTSEEVVQLLSGCLREFVTRLTDYSEENWSKEEQLKLNIGINETLKGFGGKEDVQGSE